MDLQAMELLMVLMPSNYCVGLGVTVGETPEVGALVGVGDADGADVGVTALVGVGVADDPLNTILGLLLFVSVTPKESVVS